MADPLAEVVALLEPKAPFSKIVGAVGRWRVNRAEAGRTFYAAILEGSVRLTVAGRDPVTVREGDFILIPAAFDFTVCSLVPPPGQRETARVVLPHGEIRHGDPAAVPEVRMLVGYCEFASPNASLIVSLLPDFVHVQGERRLVSLMELVDDESRERRPAREVVLARLLEAMFIEALRSSAGAGVSPGLVRGLADAKIGPALRRIHATPAAAWTVPDMAREAALSRSGFFERFRRVVGATPMEYLLGWRMALAKALLQDTNSTVAEVAERVGYGSASAFSVAFGRHVGTPPGQYARGAGSRRHPANPPLPFQPSRP